MMWRDERAQSRKQCAQRRKGRATAVEKQTAPRRSKGHEGKTNKGQNHPNRGPRGDAKGKVRAQRQRRGNYEAGTGARYRESVNQKC